MKSILSVGDLGGLAGIGGYGEDATPVVEGNVVFRVNGCVVFVVVVVDESAGDR